MKILPTTVAAVAVCLLATGCSSSAKSLSGVAAVGGSNAAAASSGSTGGGSTGGNDGSCKQLTLAEVQPLLTITVTKVTTTAITTNGTGQQCEFDAKGTDSTGSITVQVLGGSDGPTAYAQEVAGETKPVAISGVGDKASRDTEDGQINALKGSLYCSVSYSSNDLIPGVGPLEEAHGATNNIGETYWTIVAKAMGALCNRIYGSGNMTPDLSALLAADKTATPSDDGGLPSIGGLPTDASS